MIPLYKTSEAENLYTGVNLQKGIRRNDGKVAKAFA